MKNPLIFMEIQPKKYEFHGTATNELIYHFLLDFDMQDDYDWQTFTKRAEALRDMWKMRFLNIQRKNEGDFVKIKVKTYDQCYKTNDLAVQSL